MTDAHRRCWFAAFGGGLLWLLCSAVSAQLPAGALPLRVRTTLGAASMLSDSQRGWLGYDKVGAVGTLELGYALLPSLEARLGALLGGFPGGDRVGGLLQPQLGAAVMWPFSGLRPWLQLDVGAGFTGKLLRPVVRASVGVDFQLTGVWSLGPVIGYSQLFQHDRPGASTDARFFWIGAALGFSSPGPAAQRVHVERRVRVERRVHVTEQPPSEPPEPPPMAAEPVAEPSPELRALLETALPTERHEWLAPVLFAVDRAQLEPQGVAMLHEVARELELRRDIKAVEIHGYADARGDAAHNVQLSEQRARVVRDWLIAHGIAPERLRVAAHGASDLIEPGHSEQEHQQNRRVVFRVIDPDQAP